MNQELWSAVDAYVTETMQATDAVLENVLQTNRAAGLPQIDVSPPLGKLLYLLARINRAQRILEVGTLGGYSTIWLARALPEDGRLITLEVDPHHAVSAQTNLASAGVHHLVEIRLGDARESLRQLETEGLEPFDLIFIDADKPSNPEYFRSALKLSRPGSLIIIDNVIRGGAVADPDSENPSVIGVRQMNDLIAAEPRITATTIQTVGSKGYDGFTLALVLDLA